MNIKTCHITVLIAALAAPFAMAEEKPAAHEPRPDEIMRNFEVAFKQTALDAERSKAGFDHEMRQLELQQKRIELEHAKRFVQEADRPPHGPWGPGPGGPECRMTGKPGCPGPLCPLFLLFCLVVHILLAFWVNSDIKQRKMGSRIWIVIALLTGLLGTFVYALVRIGDRPA